MLDSPIYSLVQCFGHPDTKACPPIPNRLFPVPPGREVSMNVQDIVWSQERLIREVMLLSSANRQSYRPMPRRLAQQRMTLSDLEWPFHASRAISTLAELLVSQVVPSSCIKFSFFVFLCIFSGLLWVWLSIRVQLIVEKTVSEMTYTTCWVDVKLYSLTHSSQLNFNCCHLVIPDQTVWLPLGQYFAAWEEAKEAVIRK